MIFCSVGSQLPFDRMVEAIDDSADQLGESVIGQIGVTSLRPRKIQWFETLCADDFNSYAEQSSILICHAGIGSIITAAKYSKPIVMIPRLADLGEHRNDHQLATCKRFSGEPGIHICYDLNLLGDVINQARIGYVSLSNKNEDFGCNLVSRIQSLFD